MSRAFVCLAAAVALGGAACDQSIGKTVQGLTSLRVEMMSPAAGARGTLDNPINVGEVKVNVAALDELGQVIADDLDVDVYLSFAGSKIGKYTPCGDNEDSIPFTTIHLTAGRADGVTLQLPRTKGGDVRVYGPATLWFQENPKTVGYSRAYGAAPELVFRYPRIPEIQEPLDLDGPTATYCSQWNGKQVTVVDGTQGGKLVVTSVFINAYVVADTGAMYDRQTGTGGFNHMYIYSYGKPPFFVVPGRVLSRVGGNLSKFVGFTEINFPNQEPASQTDLVQIPEPYVLDKNDRGQNLRLLRLGASTVTTTARVCPIDPELDDWKKYNQFTLNFSDGVCSSFDTFSVALPSKLWGDPPFDPLKRVGKTVKVTGVLKNSSGQNQSTNPPTLCKVTDDCKAAGLDTATCVLGTCRRGPFNFWTILPRTPDDLVDITTN